MRKFTEEEITGAIEKAVLKPSENWQKETAYMLRVMAAKEDVTDYKKNRISFMESFKNLFSNPNNMFNFNNMKKIISVAAAIVLVVSGVFYYSATNTYAYHLNKAKKAIDQLELALEGNQQLSMSIIPLAYAEEEENEDEEETELDEEQIQQLVLEIIEEIEKAIEIAEDEDELAALQLALEEIKAIQAEALDAIVEAVEKVENEELSQAIAEIIETITEQQEEVEDAIEDVGDAEENGEDVDVDIETSEDEDEDEDETGGLKERTELKMREARELMAGLEAGEMELTPAMKQKYDVIQELVADCETGEKCQAGKAKGLATALNAKVRNETRKAEKAKGETGEEQDEDESSEPEESADENTEDENDSGDEETSEDDENDGDEDSAEEEDENTSEDEEDTASNGTQSNGKQGNDKKDDNTQNNSGNRNKKTDTEESE